MPMSERKEAEKMIASTTNSNLLSTTYLFNSSKTESVFFQFNGQQGGMQDNTVGSDQVSFTYQVESQTTYTQSGTIQSMANDGYELLRSMVQKVFHEQGLDSIISVGDTEIDLETLSQEDAQELVAEDGYFGIEKTSERIFQFAIGIAGNDPSRIDAIREGVAKGFQEAFDAFGGWLPQISYDTYDTVIQKLDDWIEGFDQ